MTNLFDVTLGQLSPANDKPRTATDTERTAYLRWLAEHRGVDVSGCDFNADGVWRGRGKDAECVLPMPGYGGQPRATLEYLDDAGNVLRSIPLAENAKGGLVMTAKQIADATGLKPVRKAKAARKPVEARQPAAAPIEPAPVESLPTPPAAAPVAASAPDAALLARVVMLETALRCMGLAPGRAPAPVANDNDRPRRVRSEMERRAIVRAWRIRCEARARADLDARALFAANGAYRGALDALATANDQAANARTAATAYKAEMEAACARVDEMTKAEAFLIQRGDDLRDARDAALARAAAAERALYDAEERALNAGERAARMVRAASGYRTAGRRAVQDVRSARAEARALSKRLTDARATIVASQPTAPPAGNVMANALAAVGAR